MRKWVCCVGAFAGAVLTTSESKADVYGDIYADARSVIEELITAEVAHNVAPNIACHVPLSAQLFPRSLQRVYDRQFDGLRTTLRDETSDVVAFELLQFMRTGAIAWQASPDKRQFIAPQGGSAAGLLGVTAGQQAPKKAGFTPGARCEPKDVRNSFEKGAYRGVQSSLLDTACGDPQTSLESYQCGIAYAARDLLRKQPKLAEQHLLRALAAGIVASSKRTWRSYDEAQAVESSVALVAAKIIDGKSVTDISGDIAAIAPNLLNAGASDSDIQKQVKDLEAAFRSISAQWALLARSGDPIDFVGFLTAIGGQSGPIGALCVANANPITQTCTDLLAARRALIDPKFQAITAAIQRRDYRELAITLLSSAIESAGNGCSGDNEQRCRSLVSLYGRFATATMSYVLDVAEDGHPSGTTRAAFRSAATDVLTELGGSGFDRSFGWRIIVPELALRYQWSTGYLNEGGPGNARLSATVDWLTFRIRFAHTESVFVAGQLSLVNGLGPFSEIALRKNVDYQTKPGGPWANFLNPRVDVILGVPSFSRRLAVGTTVALRMAAPTQQSDGTFGYAFVTDGDLGRRLPQFVEFGFSVKYSL
jgi:hypothetical protein